MRIKSIFLLCFEGNVEITKVLIEKGAELNAKNSVGKTPLMFAAHRGITSKFQLETN